MAMESDCPEKWLWAWKNGIFIGVVRSSTKILENPGELNNFRTCSYPEPHQVSKVSSLESVDEGG